MSWTSLITVLTLAGCQPADGPLTITERVSAQGGATLRLADGASVDVPAGALAEDAEVTFSRETCGGVFAGAAFGGCLYAVDAGGVEWADRFEITLPLRRGAEAVEAARDAEDGLRPLVDGAVSGGTIAATGSSAGTFAPRMLGANPIDERCTDVPFAPCGGAVEGRWALERACGSINQVTGISWEGPDPYATCAPHASLVDYPLEVGGNVSFGGDGSFGRFSSATIWKHEIISFECLETVGEECPPDCARDGELCDCTWEWSAGEASEGGVWSYDDEGGLLVDDRSLRHCVDGDQLTVEHRNSEGPFLMLYRRAAE